MFSIAQSRCLACAGARDMHYAGKKEFYLHLQGAGGGKLCICHKGKKKKESKMRKYNLI